MKTRGAVSGCLIWIAAFGMLSLCFLPVAMMMGGLTSTSNFALKTTGYVICPAGSTAQSYSYASTTTDEFGNRQPSTAYELHCIDEHGTVLKKDPVLYAFLWIGMVAAIGLVIAALSALALATPAGVLIVRFLDRNKKTNSTANVEPD